MKESLVKDELLQSASRIGNEVRNLNDMQDEFRTVISEIGESGHNLGGDLGEFSRGILEQEINAKLSRLSNYMYELKNAIELTAASYEEKSDTAINLMDEIK